MTKQELGRSGEERAVAAMEREGYTIVARNYRTRLGEIDVVAEEGDYLVFAEVKARSGLAWGLPREAVDERKRARMTRAAMQYAGRHGRGRPCRFDVVEVLFLHGEVAEIHIIRDAFQLDPDDIPWSE